jgi:hypothetical protein
VRFHHISVTVGTAVHHFAVWGIDDKKVRFQHLVVADTTTSDEISNQGVDVSPVVEELCDFGFYNATAFVPTLLAIISEDFRFWCSFHHSFDKKKVGRLCQASPISVEFILYLITSGCDLRYATQHFRL